MENIMAIPAITALLIASLGEDYSGFDPEAVSDVLMADKVGTPQYEEATFVSHLEALADKGEGYLDFLTGLKEQPGMAMMYGFLITNGPDGVYGLIAQMGQAGMLDKKRVKTAAKISATKSTSERAYFRKIWDELGLEAYTHACEVFEKNLDDYRKRFPEIDSESITSLMDLLWACGKTTLNAGVEKMHIKESDYEASLGFGFRIDAHAPSRNGGWDAKKGELTEKYHERMQKAAEKAAEKEAEKAPAIEAADDSEAEE